MYKHTFTIEATAANAPDVDRVRRMIAGVMGGFNPDFRDVEYKTERVVPPFERGDVVVYRYPGTGCKYTAVRTDDDRWIDDGSDHMDDDVVLPNIVREILRGGKPVEQ